MRVTAGMSDVQDELLRTLTKVANALRSAEIPFALTGGCAGYARGGPASEHDVDLLVREQDATEAVRVLVSRGLRAAEPPEDWLLKVYDGDSLVDLLFRPNERPVTEEILAMAEELPVGSVVLPVMPATYVLTSKLLVLDGHRCDFSELLPFARALREQIDWQQVRDDTKNSPYAEAFLVLIERLDIIGRDHELRAVPRGESA
ncbi:nucleotidyltransferase family protein [Nocardia sp. NRRL S-836]|uniref:nucleotidyltransferase family protein n=1 Tax=Nocardia sp. NRRL S-836 TaxID=1519492 RepID=UPI001E3CC319|nr:nucleotidyltransferase family protein [Nocardia sp. NRRL S-836]